MPRTFRPRGARRKTTWSADLFTFSGPVAAGSSLHRVIYDPSTQNTLQGLAQPTLIRVRGVVTYDWDMSPTTTGSQVGKTYTMLYVRQTDMVISAANLTDEDILWADLAGASANRAVAPISGANGIQGEYTYLDARSIIDTSAMRKLGDNRQVRFTITNSSSSNVSVRVSAFLRLLFKD